jgi:hypothetical protein
VILFEELIKRIRALTCKLLPVQVDLDEISRPTSRIVTPKVVAAYSQAAGDFGEAVGYWPFIASMTHSDFPHLPGYPSCHTAFCGHGRHSFGSVHPLHSRFRPTYILQDANHNPADYDEHMGRGIVKPLRCFHERH